MALISEAIKGINAALEGRYHVALKVLKPELAVVDLDGNIEPLPVRATPQRPSPRYSPDGRRIAFDDQGDIHVFDTELGTNGPRTFEGAAYHPVWSPDGAAIAFHGAGFMRGVAADGSTPSEGLSTDSAVTRGGFSHAWLPDGTSIYYRNGDDLLTARVSAEADFDLLSRETVLSDLTTMLSIPFSSSYDIHPDGDRFVFFMGDPTT